MTQFSMGGLLARFGASLALVLATYNPTGTSVVHWIAGSLPHVAPLQAVVAIALTGAWLFFLHSTWRSLGTLGVALGLAFFGALIWLLVSWGWLSLANRGAMTWALLVVVACLLTTGLSWALLQARVTGQAIVDETERR